MDFAYLPYLVADGEEGDGYDDKDGEDEVEYEPGEVILDARVGIIDVYHGDDSAGNDAYNYGTDSEQAQVIPAEQTHDVPRVGTMNLAQCHFLLSAT